MIGSLKTSLIQSGLSERRAGGREWGGGGGGRRGRSEHKPWGIDWNRQCVLSERLPIHRSFLRPLPYQGSSVEGAAAKPCKRSSSSIPEAPLVFTPTHRLAKEMRARGVQAQTYHSFFRWSGQTDWTPEKMGQKFVPRVII